MLGVQDAIFGCYLSQCSQNDGEDKVRLEASGGSEAAPYSSSRADSVAHVDASGQVSSLSTRCLWPCFLVHVIDDFGDGNHLLYYIAAHTFKMTIQIPCNLISAACRNIDIRAANGLVCAQQDYHEIRLVLRVPRSNHSQQNALTGSAAAKAPASHPPETALGVDGIELREQTHEEALLNTIGERLLLCSPAHTGCFVILPLCLSESRAKRTRTMAAMPCVVGNVSLFKRFLVEGLWRQCL